MSENLFTELVHKLIEAEIDFSFHFVVQELLAEHGEGVHCAIIVEVQGVQHIPVGIQCNIILQVIVHVQYYESALA